MFKFIRKYVEDIIIIFYWYLINVFINICYIYSFFVFCIRIKVDWFLDLVRLFFGGFFGVGRGRDDELGFMVDGGWNSCFFDLNGIDLEDFGVVIVLVRLVMEGRERRERERKRYGVLC